MSCSMTRHSDADACQLLNVRKKMYERFPRHFQVGKFSSDTKCNAAAKTGQVDKPKTHKKTSPDCLSKKKNARAVGISGTSDCNVKYS